MKGLRQLRRDGFVESQGMSLTKRSYQTAHDPMCSELEASGILDLPCCWKAPSLFRRAEERPPLPWRSGGTRRNSADATLRLSLTSD